MDLSYCVVNTNGREHLKRCLAAIARTDPPELESEILVLDNASDDGSAQYVRDEHPEVRLIALDRRTGKAENDSTLLAEAQGRYALLLNEDAELQPDATVALIAALDADPSAGAAGAMLLDPRGRRLACAWRLPSLGTALAGAVFCHRLLVTQSRGTQPRRVGWVQSAAMLVRREAAEAVGYLDPAFFVYSDETDFCKRLGDAGWAIVHVPGAEAVHHEQLATDRAAERRRIVEFHRGRDLYMRKHHSAAGAALARLLHAWTYLPRALAALVLPGHDPRRYLLHARAALSGGRGEGLREAAELRNKRIAAATGD
jgi:N-acetylglucosaminyl-diphospho-decaprenol L-rhamnosyltransferase